MRDIDKIRPEGFIRRRRRCDGLLLWRSAEEEEVEVAPVVFVEWI